MTKTPCSDLSEARQRLASHGWIKPKAENFRHLAPPALTVWQSETLVSVAPTDGWTVQALDPARHDQFEADFLDPAEPAQRNTLFEGLPWPDESDAAHFGWVHRATCQRGLHLRVGAPAAASLPTTITLVLRMASPAPFDAPLLRIDVAPGVHCVLLEQHEFDMERVGGVQNLDMHITLGARARLQHLRVVNPAPADRLAHQIHVALAQDAHYHQVLMASGSAYHLQRTQVDLSQPHSKARIGAALLVADATLDLQVALSHTAAHSDSAVEALMLASGRAHAVVNAYTRIAPGSDDASVRQRLSAIPTSGQPRVVLRPHMEIHHDQVQAAHGATFGALPEDALFYARQRGLDEASALALILEGLQRTVLERAMDDPEILQTLNLDTLLTQMTHRHLEPVAS